MCGVVLIDIATLPPLIMFDTPFGMVLLPRHEVLEFVTTYLAENPYWMWSRLVDKEEILEVLEVLLDKKKKIDSVLIKKVAFYVLFYAENICFSNYLWAVAENKQEALEYKKMMTPVLQKLRRLAKKASLEAFKEMLDLCLDWGLDPF